MKCLGESYWGCDLLHIDPPSILGKSPSLPFTPLPTVKPPVKPSNFVFHNNGSGYNISLPSPLPGPGLPPERQDTKSLLLKLGRGAHWLNSTATTTPLYNHIERPYPKGDVIANGVIDDCR